MRLVVQRVARASVSWSEEGGDDHRESIGEGLVILVGIGSQDRESDADRLAAKVATLRIFADADGRFNRSLEEIGGGALVVSQFTLYADASRGRRPSFVGAAAPDAARHLYRHFAVQLAERGITVATGGFGAHMTVSLDNEGPVTIVLSTDLWDTGA